MPRLVMLFSALMAHVLTAALLTAALLGLVLAIISVNIHALTLTVTPLPRSLNCLSRFGTRSLASLPKLVGSLVVQLILLAAALTLLVVWLCTFWRPLAPLMDSQCLIASFLC